MSRDEFDALVRRLEGHARRRPGSYKLRVGLLAALGYAYVLGVVVGLLGMIAAVVTAAAVRALPAQIALKLGIGLAAFACLIGRALWVRFPVPEGFPLDPGQAPRLLGLVAELTTALKAPRFHRLMITGDFNAAVVQIPRLGALGWRRNYLLLGLPLMAALTPDEFRAVLAHELGHLSGNHGRFSGWIYRVRQSWARLLTRLEQERHWGSFVFTRFFRWYAPFFAAYSFVLGRAQEYEADAIAAEQAGRHTAAETLVKIAVQAHFLERTFWPGFLRAAERMAAPPSGPYPVMLRAVGDGLPAQEIGQGLLRSLEQKTGNADTHPSLRDRLATLGWAPEISNGEGMAVQWDPLSQPLEISAAGHFLGEAAEELAAQLDGVWVERATPRWRERYEYVQASLRQLDALNAKAVAQPLTVDEAWDRARWTAEFRGSEAALPALRDLVGAHPQHGPANYALGQILLERDEPSGVACVEKAMERDPDAVLPGCDLLHGFFRRRGLEEDARRILARYDEYLERFQQAREERSRASRRDRFLPHGLPEGAISALRGQLARDREIRAAFLVRKAVGIFPEKPCFVLCVVHPYVWWKFQRADRDRRFAHRLATRTELPQDTLVLVVSLDRRKWARVLGKIPGSRIYERRRQARTPGGGIARAWRGP